MYVAVSKGKTLLFGLTLLALLNPVPAAASGWDPLCALVQRLVGRELPPPTETEATARERFVEARLLEMGESSARRLSRGERKAGALQRVHETLSREGRSFSSLSEAESRELVDWALAEVDLAAERSAHREEAAARVNAFTEEIYGEPFGELSISRLSTARVRSILLEALREDLAQKNTQFRDLSKAERTLWAKRAVSDVTVRGDLAREIILAAQAERGVPFALSYEKMLESTLRAVQDQIRNRHLSFRDLPREVQKSLLDSALTEVVTCIGPVNKALDEGIASTNRPWNWQLFLKKRALRELLMDALEQRLSSQKRTFTSLTRAEREQMARELVDAALAPYRSRPNLIAIGVGLGAPIGFAYAAGPLMPEAARPAWYVLTSVVSYTFTFGVTYWVNGVLKPYFALNQRMPAPIANTPVDIEIERHLRGNAPASGETPFFRDMMGVGTGSTSIPDWFKDGRNITKDGELNPRDSMNDAAWRIRDEEDARKTLAGAILYQSTTFPETKIESLLSFLLYMKLKERFANRPAYESVRSHIVALAKESHVASQDALVRLDRMLRPDRWEVGAATLAPFSAEADAEIRTLLRPLQSENVTVESAAKQLAWAALFYELQYPGTRLSNATTFELYMEMKSRLSLSEVHSRASAIVGAEAPALKVATEKVEARLTALLRTDLWLSQ